MRHIRDSKEKTLDIRPNSNPQWCVDGSCAVNPDIRRYTGIIMTNEKEPYRLYGASS